MSNSSSRTALGLSSRRAFLRQAAGLGLSLAAGSRSLCASDAPPATRAPGISPEDVAAAAADPDLASLLVVDAHCDMFEAGQAHMKKQPPEKRRRLDLHSEPFLWWDAPRDKLRAGNVTCVFLNMGDDDLADSVERFEDLNRMCAEHPADYRLCRSAADIRSARESGRIAILPSIEGMGMFQRDPANVAAWHVRGVQVMSLIHVADGRPESLQDKSSPLRFFTPEERAGLRQAPGLRPWAWDLVREAERLGVTLDLAHSNDAAFWEVLEKTRGPVCYTHGGCFARCPYGRNLTDDMIKALAARGGVMGIGFAGRFISQDPAGRTLDGVCDHILHALEVAGPRHVGIGSDFQGRIPPAAPPKDATQMPALFARLRELGVDLPTLRLIAGENFLRLLPA